MAITAPTRLSTIPNTLLKLNCSLKIREENRARNTGLFAMMMDALPAETVLSPARNRTLYAKTPVRPSRTAVSIWGPFSLGSPPSSEWQITRRKTEANTNRRNEPEKGPISGAMILPAMNVPPQKMAVRISLR